MKLGRTLYGKKWHILRENGTPLCGYMSFSWAIEHKEVEVENLSGYNICKGCLLKTKEGKSGKAKKGKTIST